MQLLDHRQITQKIRRLAIEVMERNTEENELIIAGINNNGMTFARLLHAEVDRLATSPIHLTHIRLNPADPLREEIRLEPEVSFYQDKAVLIVDDVANTGRTLFYATKPLLNVLPRKIEVAVLVDRKHKSFPIRVDYVGMELATTLRENIRVSFGDPYSVHLE